MNNNSTPNIQQNIKEEMEKMINGIVNNIIDQIKEDLENKEVIISLFVGRERRRLIDWRDFAPLSEVSDSSLLAELGGKIIQALKQNTFFKVSGISFKAEPQNLEKCAGLELVIFFSPDKEVIEPPS